MSLDRPTLPLPGPTPALASTAPEPIERARAVGHGARAVSSRGECWLSDRSRTSAERGAVMACEVRGVTVAVGAGNARREHGRPRLAEGDGGALDVRRSPGSVSGFRWQPGSAGACWPSELPRGHGHLPPQPFRSCPKRALTRAPPFRPDRPRPSSEDPSIGAFGRLAGHLLIEPPTFQR